MGALSRWWDLGIAVAAAAAAVIVVTSGPALYDVIAGGIAIALLVGSWLLAGRRAFEGDTRSIVFSIALVLATGLLVSVNPILAMAQTISYPLVWMLSRDLRWALVFNAAISLAVAGGMLISTGSLLSAGITAVLSLAFSIAFGLWITRIATLSEERRTLLEELTAAQAELAVLHRDAGVTSERERLARELHDTIAQSLAGLVLLSQRARRDLAAGRLADATLGLIEDGARDALAETRALVAGAAPVELSAGLPAALVRLAERFERETGIDVATSTGGTEVALDRDAEVVLLRSAQEGLANIRKHAEASRARLELAVGDGVAALTVRDDGRGFDPASAHGGFGLSGLRDRLALVGGTVDVASEAGATTLTVRLPIGGPT